MTLQVRSEVPPPYKGEIVALQEYREQGMNVLSPTPVIRRVSPFHQIRVELVYLSCVDADRDTYKSRTFCNENERALAKNGLQKLARAAGIQWDTDRCRRLDDMKDLCYVCYEAVGGIRLPDGTWQWMKSMKEVDLREGGSEEAKLRKQVQYKLTHEVEVWTNGKKVRRRWTPAEAEEFVEKELVAAREHKLSNCETKAMLRVVRSILQIKPSYTLQELSKPFAVPHLDFAPDYNDPQIRQMMLSAGMAAQGALFGGQPVMPSAEVRQMQGPTLGQALPALGTGVAGNVHEIPVGDDDDDGFREDDACVEGEIVSESEAPKVEANVAVCVRAMQDAMTMEELKAIAAEHLALRREGQYNDEQWIHIREVYDATKKQMGGCAA